VTNEERSRVLGRVLMGGAAVQLLLFIGAVVRRSYLAIALPVGFAVAALSAVAFWVGYTMAYARWDEDEEPTILRRRAVGD
jgi:hypothetical protein